MPVHPAPVGVPASGVLRDRLANERTLLSWLRTATALMGFGLVVARFGLFLKALLSIQTAVDPGELARQGESSHIVGAGLLLLGGLVAVIGWQRTRAYGRLIDPIGGGPSQRVLGLTALLVAGLGFGLATHMLILGSIVR